MPNTSDGEYQDVTPSRPVRPTAKTKDTKEVILAAKRKNPMRKDDKDGPSDPNEMYWDTAPMDILAMQDEEDVPLHAVLTLGVLLLAVGAFVYWYILHGPQRFAPPAVAMLVMSAPTCSATDDICSTRLHAHAHRPWAGAAMRTVHRAAT